MRFLVDAQLPPGLARWLVAEGHEAAHVLDHGLESADDGAVWRHAESVGAVILTKDEDFAARRIRANEGPAVVWIRVGNTHRRALLDWFRAALPDVLVALDRGDRLVEIR